MNGQIVPAFRCKLCTDPRAAYAMQDLEAHLVRHLEKRVLESLPAMVAAQSVRKAFVATMTFLLPCSHFCVSSTSRNVQNRRSEWSHTQVLAELDAILALSSCAVEYKLIRPTLTRDNTLDIDGGWHPLLQQLARSCRPLSRCLACAQRRDTSRATCRMSSVGASTGAKQLQTCR